MILSAKHGGTALEYNPLITSLCLREQTLIILGRKTSHERSSLKSVVYVLWALGNDGVIATMLVGVLIVWSLR